MRRRKHSFVLLSTVIAAALGWGAWARADDPAQPPADKPAQPAADRPAEPATPPQASDPATTNPPAEAGAAAPADQQQQPAAGKPQRHTVNRPTGESPHMQAMHECIQACRECAQICNRTSWYAYNQAGTDQALRDVQQLTGDCQRFCDFAVQMMERRSPLMGVSCGACETACSACEMACEAAGGNNQLLKDCAESCRKCSEACKKMVATMGSGEHAEHAEAASPDKPVAAEHQPAQPQR